MATLGLRATRTIDTETARVICAYCVKIQLIVLSLTVLYIPVLEDSG
jgi:hypothetical protein